MLSAIDYFNQMRLISFLFKLATASVAIITIVSVIAELATTTATALLEASNM